MHLEHLVDHLTITPGLQHVLTTSLDNLDDSALPRTLRKRIAKRFRKALHAPTVLDVAREAANPVEQRAVAAWIAEVAVPQTLDDEPIADLYSGMPESELDEWARHHHVEGVLDLPARELAGRYRLRSHFDDDPVRAVITGGVIAPPRLAYALHDLADRLIEALYDLVDRREASLAYEEEARAWRDQRPPSAPLARLWEQVLRRRAPERARALPLLDSDEISAHVDEATDCFVLECPRLDIPPIRIPLSDGRIPDDLPESPVVRLALFDCLLDILTAPADAMLREQLAALLGTPAWERDLLRLDRALAPPDPSPDDDKRLVGWRVDDGPAHGQIEALRCRLKKTGSGYVSRRASVRSIPLALLTEPADRVVAQLLDSSPTIAIARVSVLHALIGHPRVFTATSGNTPVPVRSARFAIAIQKDAAGIHLVPSLDGTPIPIQLFLTAANRVFANGLMAFVEADRIRVAKVPLPAVDMLRAWSKPGRPLASEALPALLQRLPLLSERAPIAIDDALAGERVEGDRRPLVRLSWHPGGLDISIRVRPLPDLVPHVPGDGPETLFAVREGATVHVRRALVEEPAIARSTATDLGITLGEAFDVHVASLDEALPVIERLQARRDDHQIEWEGAVPSVRGSITAADLRLQINRGRDWFGLSGTAQVDGVEVPLQSLLEAVEEGRGFVTLGDGAWARIHDALRESLRAASATAPADRSGARKLSPLHAPLVEALGDEGALIEAPTDWFSLVDRLREARELQAPVPDTVTASLRDYQLVGFRWLASLAHWAPGAVLADDMGLGKTLQAITLLSHRAALGPALVIVPTSVVHNWHREIERFAPALTIRHYRGSERARALDGLGAGDVVITSYGLLTRDAEALAAHTFSTLVLDEAQAIKNALAKRSQAAHGLNAGFCLALSGTPIENHLGELWSLFQATAPGLLGSWNRFRDRFVVPIEARGDRDMRKRLAELIRPFVLRRTKREVATELPPRVESVIDVDLTAAERALYDRARLSALARVESAGAAARIEILAELTKLRMLVCHPRLVDASSSIASSKLKQILRVLDDLCENEHRALVFSQFTTHLAIVRAALTERGRRIAYLDGSMSPDQREAEVQRFQRGEADFFLLSLGAGGTGLNLTNASYVLHLDPWWNPAKEDQATDRAHRIGQDKTVTVYRFVCRGTIEEQIVALHAEKRELADALLEGTGDARRASTEDLRALLADAATAETVQADEADVEDPPDERPNEMPTEGVDRAFSPDELQTALFARLEAEFAAGTLARRATVKAYQNVAAHFCAWLRDNPCDAGRSALLSATEGWIARARAGQTAWKSDRANANALRPRVHAALDALASGDAPTAPDRAS